MTGSPFKITKRTVDALTPREKPFIAYVLEYRPHGRGRQVAKKRLTLGRHGAMTQEQARRAAQTALARIPFDGEIAGFGLRVMPSGVKTIGPAIRKSQPAGGRLAS